MNVNTAASVAATLECEPELLPYLPELLQDLDSLGSEPDTVIDLLQQRGEGHSARILDLCCGKGATAIALAKTFGCSVHGIDAMQAFIDSAREAAGRTGVEDLCHFEVGDVTEILDSLQGFDGVLFGAIGPIFGGITPTVRRLLGPLRPGGWLLIEDSVLKPGSPIRAGYENHAGFEETQARMLQAGAVIEAFQRLDVKFMTSHAEDQPQLEARAKSLLQRKPHLATQVKAYLDRQWEEVRYLEECTEDVTWLLRKQD